MTKLRMLSIAAAGAASLGLGAMAVACGGDDTGSGSNPDASTPHDAGRDTAVGQDVVTLPDTGTDTSTPADAGVDSPVNTDGGGDSGCSGVVLTVKDYLSWCTLFVADGGGSAATPQTFCVPPGTVNLSATANNGFELGPAPWHHTAGDLDGGGDPGTLVGDAASNTTVVVTTGTACVWACCPFPNGGGCPATDQCP